jgi:hypothetical protein
MDGQTVTAGAAIASVLAEARSQGLSTKDSTSSEAHKRKFLEAFRRWEILFRRKDGGDVQAEKWLIAEYYDSLKHLSNEGFEALTRQLKESCTFFPSVKECLELTRPASRFDWAHPFLNKPEFFAPRPTAPQLAAPVRQISHDAA